MATRASGPARRFAQGVEGGQRERGREREHCGECAEVLQQQTADAAAAIASAFDDSRTEYLEAGRVASSQLQPITIGVSETIPAAKAAEFRERLAGLIQELHETEHDDEGIQVRLFTVFYGLAEAEA
ncbi:hypothetical protein ACH4S8_44560 [Streptomyces sp. NPDC021080]|uniref:hypothetical protein n=1 Tax=Streptomyces sp. NPDC021080 TaxID=3365110 RepID=UPI0037A06751